MNKFKKSKNNLLELSEISNTVCLGDSEIMLKDFPKKSIDLVFTSPPSFNLEYSEYSCYLNKMKRIFENIYEIMNEGRFFVLRTSPVLLHRKSRQESSKRIAVPFDLHNILINCGFDFIDDIIWQKPFNTEKGRGIRFSVDRNALQYKPNPITEYILVYRKHSDKLIDWNIHKHPNQELVKDSKINIDYQKTNIWNFGNKSLDSDKSELFENVIRYYSFLNDVVLDPFANQGDIIKIAHQLKRRFVYIDLKEKNITNLKGSLSNWFYEDYNNINWINTEKPFNDTLNLNF